jgi:hypothetical protein
MHLRADSCITELLGRKNGEHLVDRDGVKTGHATHPWLPLRIIWFAMAAFVWSLPFMASIWRRMLSFADCTAILRAIFANLLAARRFHFERTSGSTRLRAGPGEILELE